jgi:formyl-CoA transferase
MTLQPLDGIRVLDITEAHVGPSATVLLADMGAEVIKVEPLRGDRVRLLGKLVGYWTESGKEAATGVPAQFLAINRNKKSIAIDLKQPAGAEIVRRLAKKCDVFVQNMRPGAIQRLGLGYEEIRSINPRIVYASASGWGLLGPEAGKRAVDITAQARTGVMAQTGSNDQPTPCGPAVCDHIAGLYFSYAIMAGLMARERFGIGQHVDVSLLGSGIALHGREITQLLVEEGIESLSWRKTFGVFWNAFRARDGWICLGGLQEHSWPGFCRAAGLEHLSDDPRYSTHAARLEREPELEEMINQAFSKFSRDELLARLEVEGLIVAPVQTLREVSRDPQTAANGYIVEVDYPGHGPVKVVGSPIKMSATPFLVRRASPELGEHTRDVLASLEYTEEEIERLLAENVCGQPTATQSTSAG